MRGEKAWLLVAAALALAPAVALLADAAAFQETAVGCGDGGCASGALILLVLLPPALAPPLAIAVGHVAGRPAPLRVAIALATLSWLIAVVAIGGLGAATLAPAFALLGGSVAILLRATRSSTRAGRGAALAVALAWLVPGVLVALAASGDPALGLLLMSGYAAPLVAHACP